MSVELCRDFGDVCYGGGVGVGAYGGLVGGWWCSNRVHGGWIKGNKRFIMDGSKYGTMFFYYIFLITRNKQSHSLSDLKQSCDSRDDWLKGCLLWNTFKRELLHESDWLDSKVNLASDQSTGSDLNSVIKLQKKHEVIGVKLAIIFHSIFIVSLYNFFFCYQ